MFSHFLRKLGSVFGVSAPTETHVVHAGGIIWHVAESGRELFADAGLDVEKWIESGRAVLVKQNRQRSIHRVELEGVTVYLKHCRINTPRAWAREILRPAKAKLEFDNALSIRAQGGSAIEPLAWGAGSERLPGDSYIITLARPGAISFLDCLERDLPKQSPERSARATHAIAEGFARFLAELNEVGIVHPDPHPGNFLCEIDFEKLNEKRPKFFLVDLHAIRFGKSLSQSETRENLILLNRWFQIRASRTDRLRFWLAYAALRKTFSSMTKSEVATMARRLEEETRDSNNAFWVARKSRWLGDNRDSRFVKGKSASGFAVRDLPEETLQNWLSDPDAPFGQKTSLILKDSRTSKVAEIDLQTPDGSIRIIYKRFNLKARLGAVKNLVRPSPALRSWINGYALLDRHIRTARPLAVFHRGRFGFPLTGYVAFEKIGDALELPEAVRSLERLPSETSRQLRGKWLEMIGRQVRLLHDRQVSHRDLKPANILMSRAAIDLVNAVPVLIDTVGVETGREVAESIRVRDIARLNAGFLSTPSISNADRLRFLKAYMEAVPRMTENWRVWWIRIDQATSRKVRKNLRTGRPLT